jgi:hypothetical protein
MEPTVAELEQELDKLSSEPYVGEKVEVTKKLLTLLAHGRLVMNDISTYLDECYDKEKILNRRKTNILFGILVIVAFMLGFYNIAFGVFVLIMSYIFSSIYWFSDISVILEPQALIITHNLKKIHFYLAESYLINNQYTGYKRVFKNYDKIYTILAKFDKDHIIDNPMTLYAITNCLKEM